MTEEASTLLQFVPFSSFVESNFWYKLNEIKLDHDRLSDAPRNINGFYTNRNAKGCLLQVDYTAFNSDFKAPKFCHAAHGTLYNKNTIEDFKQCDKQALLNGEGQKLLDDIKTGRALEQPSLLARFFVLSFADIKCHTFYYWFAFPCPLTAALEVVKPAQVLSSLEETALPVLRALKSLQNETLPFFILDATKPDEILDLKTVLTAGNLNVQHLYFCFADASDTLEPSWLMRIYVAFICYHCPQLVGQVLNFIGLRYENTQQYLHSVLWQVCQKDNVDLSDVSSLKFVGWERNRNDRMGPRVVNLQEQMDPVLIAENSVNLNLKLMKWRLLPDLNLEAMKTTKCLLFGAGTLGCAVARNLLSWGFKHITLIDNGRVGYSNPIRQSLYLYEDAKSGKAMKATTAAKRLKDINPSAITAGHVMQIPMPGHTIGESLLKQTLTDLATIEQLVQTHDVIYLLTDSRESRWLPTLLGNVHQKIVINAALGFDSYLVMRHGAAIESDALGDCASTSQIDNLKCINGHELGCYFCNDITAPGNSQKDRTLDQQCTVTRPGVSNIAASYAVELLVSLLQHPQHEHAPAYYSNSTESTVGRIPEGQLGIIPHSIRGNLYDFQNILPATQRFEQCIACSKRVIDEYRSQGNNFLLKVFETAKYLEDLTGISAYKELDSKVIDFDDAEFEMSENESD